MEQHLSRRHALGLGAAAAATGAFATAAPASAAPGESRSADAAEAAASPNDRIRKAYRRQKAAAGGVWHSHIAKVDSKGKLRTVLADDADTVTHGYSVQKLAVATAVLDKVDRGHLSLNQKVDLPRELILTGSGIYHLHGGAYGDQITVANFLTAMLLVSDNTAVRLCGRLVPTVEVNDILAAKCFVKTRVEPGSSPNRFFLGTTTPREMHDLLWRLANKTLLSRASCDFLLRVTTGLNGYHDGVRRTMSSNERSRVATKYGADFNVKGASRHEAGIMFGTDGSPVLTYAMFADGLGELDNYGSTHPAVQAHAVIGRTMFDAIATATTPKAAAKQHVVPFRAVDGN